MSFWEHLDELLSRLRIIFISIIASGLLIGFWPADPRGFLDPTGLYRPMISVVMQKMRNDLLPAGARLIAGGLMDTAYVYITLSFLVGIVISSPLIGYQLYAFINPALYPHERRYVARFLFAFLGLFAFGVVMAYYLMLPLSFRIIVWFIESGGAEPLINIQDFYNMIITLMVGSGLLYTAPVFIVLLVQAGILPANFISGKRKLMYVGFLVVTAVITPDPTIITDVIIMLPFIMIFESAVLAAKRVERKKAQPAG
ncbi:twin-arginine translocase subunit TatC [Candidatus Bathyarchaeota archaeon]|nr:twin-arginine translocase subunit TatC [Candidatus Bathyarchaeota archaeon]